MTLAMEASFPACWKWRLQGTVGLILSCHHKGLEVSELMCLFVGFPVIHTCNSCSVFSAFVFTVMELLFSEELGLVLEVSQLDVETVCQIYSDAGMQCHRVGRTCAFGPEAEVRHQRQHAS